MDNATKIGSFDQSKEILGSGADMVANTGKKDIAAENSRGNTIAFYAATFGATLFAELLAAPKGEAAKEVISYKLPTEYTFEKDKESQLITCLVTASEPHKATRRQIRDAFNVAALQGIPAAHRSAYSKYMDKVVLKAHEALLVSPAKRMIQGSLSNWKRAATTRIREENFAKLQEEENIRAKMAGEEPKDIRREAQASDRDPLVRIAECFTKAWNIAANAEDIDCDVNKLVAHIKAGYSLINQPVPKRDDGEK